jgi:hypothetical protein
MANCRIYTYEVLKTRLDSNRSVMVQIFRNPDTLDIIHAQLAFKTDSLDSWGVPYQLEVAQ